MLALLAGRIYDHAPQQNAFPLGATTLLLMRRTLILSLLLGATAVGCQPDRSGVRPDSTRGGLSTAQAPATQSIALSVDDGGCEANPDAAHPNPQRLISEYLDRGGRGEFLASSAWHDGAVECPGHTPGFDSATLVTGWRLSTLRETADSVLFQVAFDRHSDLTQDSTGMYLVPAAGVELDTIIAVRKPFGWRVGGFEFQPHVLPMAAKARLQLREGDQRLIDSLITLSASRPGA